MDILSFLEKEKISYRIDLPLSAVTSIGTGGTARLATYPASSSQLISLINFCQNGNATYRVLGRMTNTLPPDGVCSETLIFTDAMRDVSLSDGIATLSCGCVLSRTARRFAEQGISVLHRLASVPGSVGGAVRGNAGAFGAQTSDDFLCAELFDPQKGETFVADRRQMCFRYRYSILKEKPWILLSASFRTRVAEQEVLEAEMQKIRLLRRQSQPTSPSLGSIFLKVGDTSAAYYIDRAGLKGTRVGGVCVSEKHAGFIVRDGDATSGDVRALIRCIQDTVYGMYGIRLITEIEIMDSDNINL